jgi:hypothetical protein
VGSAPAVCLSALMSCSESDSLFVELQLFINNRRGGVARSDAALWASPGATIDRPGRSLHHSTIPGRPRHDDPPSADQRTRCEVTLVEFAKWAADGAAGRDGLATLVGESPSALRRKKAPRNRGPQTALQAHPRDEGKAFQRAVRG